MLINFSKSSANHSDVFQYIRMSKVGTLCLFTRENGETRSKSLSSGNLIVASRIKEIKFHEDVTMMSFFKMAERYPELTLLDAEIPKILAKANSLDTEDLPDMMQTTGYENIVSKIERLVEGDDMKPVISTHLYNKSLRDKNYGLLSIRNDDHFKIFLSIKLFDSIFKDPSDETVLTEYLHNMNIIDVFLSVFSTAYEISQDNYFS